MHSPTGAGRLECWSSFRDEETSLRFHGSEGLIYTKAGAAQYHETALEYMLAHLRGRFAWVIAALFAVYCRCSAHNEEGSVPNAMETRQTCRYDPPLNIFGQDAMMMNVTLAAKVFVGAPIDSCQRD